MDHEEIEELQKILLGDSKLLHQRHGRFRFYNRKRDRVITKHQVDELAKRIRIIKEKSIPRMNELYHIARENFEERGTIAHFAKTAEDARRIAENIIGNATPIVHSSTDMIAEIGLNSLLAKKKVPLIHTTATFRLLQRANLTFPLFDRPNPIENLTPQLAQQLNETLFSHTKYTKDLLANIRDETKDLIQNAPIGITGANAVAANDGVMTLAFSQGNTSLVANRPTHLAIIGLEKLVPKYTDAVEVTYLQGLLEAGANGARYYLQIGGPSKLPEIYEPRESGYTAENLHLLFVDNNRTAIAQSTHKELLYCVRCFACIHHCPAYTALGPGLGPDMDASGFGHKGYVGGRELALVALTSGIHLAVKGGLYACTLCGACKQECPLDIDTPTLIQKLRKNMAN